MLVWPRSASRESSFAWKEKFDFIKFKYLNDEIQVDD